MNRVHGWIKVLSTWCVGLLCGFALGQAVATTGAVSTTDNVGWPETVNTPLPYNDQACQNGTGVNCNIYIDKRDVWLSGLPVHACVNDGTYFFAVLDPGAQHDPNDGAAGNLSDDFDSYQDRTFQVTNCVISNLGTHAFDPASNKLQLYNYADTQNPGGVYILAVCEYDPATATATGAPGVDPKTCKYDAFKVVASAQPTTISIVACKFNDRNDDGVYDPNGTPKEPLIPDWPIVATINGTPVTQNTDDSGCTIFTVLPTDTVVLNEGPALGSGWTQTAPNPADTNPEFAVDINHFVTLNNPIADGTTVYFGNWNPACSADGTCEEPPGLDISKTANNTPTWTIKKSVDNNELDLPAGSTATFNYTVSVTYAKAGVVRGTITLANNSPADIYLDSNTPHTTGGLADALSDGTNCSFDDPMTPVPTSVAAGQSASVNYTCSSTATPLGSVTNTATVYWQAGSTFPAGNASTDPVKITLTDQCANVKDPLATNPPLPAKVCVGDANPTKFNYSYQLTAPSGKCTTYTTNTATLTPVDSGVPQTDSQKVRACGGSDLTVSKTAAGSYSALIQKTAKSTSPVEASGSSTLNYTVSVTESGWQVKGVITVTNPNDWEDVSVSVSDLLSDSKGSCTVGALSANPVVRSTSSTANYTCSFASPPPSSASGTNQATITWNAAAAFTADGTASSSKVAYSFTPLQVSDVCPDGTSDGFKALGGSPRTITGITASTSLSASCVVSPPPGTCTTVKNKATLSGDSSVTITGSPAYDAGVTVCNTNTGALTMGFWQNNNGQGIIKGPTPNAACTTLTNYLRGFNPFQDLSSTATCAQVATYVYNLIHGAGSSCGGSTCNAMLKAQMLATALDVYFSTPSLGGNKIGPYNGLGNATPALGSVKVDLTKICPKADGGGGTCPENTSAAFSTPPTCQTVSTLLSYAASQAAAATAANPLASKWYLDVKATQVLAKDTFDSINNDAAPLCQ